MSEELNNSTQEEAVNSTDETTSTDEQAAAETSEQSIGEMMGTEEVKDEPKTIGLDKFLDIKKENKALKKQLKEIADRIEDGGDSEVSSDIEALADEHNIDRDFLKKLTKSLEAKATKSLEERINEKLAPIEKYEQKEKLEKAEKAFSNAFSKALDRMPEYDGIANPEVVKALAMQPSNSKKTISQLLEEAYGGAVTQGRATIETTKAGGGKDPQKVDFARAQADAEYFKQVMADPKLKAEYNSKAMNDVLNYL